MSTSRQKTENAPVSTGRIGVPSSSPRMEERARFSATDLSAVAALAFIVIFSFATVIFSLPFSPTTPDVNAIGLPPSATHLFGTDATGFDVFSRVIDAASRDVPIAISGSLLSLLLGVPVGLLASGGRFGDILMRALDGFSALPILVLVIVAIQLLGGTAFDVIVAIAVVNTPRFARLTRAEAVSLRSARFVEAAIACGCSPMRIAVQHIFRNAYGVVLVQATLAAANAIGVIAALNFLGVGISPPTPTWGGMIRDGTTLLINGQWWAAAFPTIAIFLVVVALNIVADGIEGRAENIQGGRS